MELRRRARDAIIKRLGVSLRIPHHRNMSAYFAGLRLYARYVEVQKDRNHARPEIHDGRSDLGSNSTILLRIAYDGILSLYADIDCVDDFHILCIFQAGSSFVIRMGASWLWLLSFSLFFCNGCLFHMHGLST